MRTDILYQVTGPSNEYNVWWKYDRIYVSCPKCGFMTSHMDPQYSKLVTLDGGEFICPDCRKMTVIELRGSKND